MGSSAERVLLGGRMWTFLLAQAVLLLILGSVESAPKTTPTPEKLTTRQTVSTTSKHIVPKGCVSDCTGRRNGDYHSCLGCHVYATCSNEIISDNRPCPSELIWDNKLRLCLQESST